MAMRINHAGWADILSASVRGASHVASGVRCQDAVSVKEGFLRGEPYLLCSVADGHGHPDCMHSDTGSVLASLAAEQAMMFFLLRLAGRRTTRARFFGQCVRENVQALWMEHIRVATRSCRTGFPEALEYGTTLLMAAVFRNRLYTAQLGDGNILVCGTSGEALTQLPDDTGPDGHATDSLCSPGSEDRWKFNCLPMADVGLVTMSTDGLINSLNGNGEYLKLARTLGDYLRRYTAPEINGQLPGWLAKYSRRGCGDDISLVAVSPRRKPETEKEEDHETAPETQGD